MSEVSKVLDGIPVVLKDGTIIVCQAPTTRQTRILIRAYNRVLRAPLPDGATADQYAVDEQERRDAMQVLVDTFPDAVGAPELADKISSGDILTLMPDFFWKRTGARVQLATAAAPATPAPSPTGTPAGASGSPPSA